MFLLSSVQLLRFFQKSLAIFLLMFLRTLRINLRTQKQGKKFEEMQTDRRLASLILDRLIIGPIFP